MKIRTLKLHVLYFVLVFPPLFEKYVYDKAVGIAINSGTVSFSFENTCHSGISIGKLRVAEEFFFSCLEILPFYIGNHTYCNLPQGIERRFFVVAFIDFPSATSKKNGRP